MIESPAYAGLSRFPGTPGHDWQDPACFRAWEQPRAARVLPLVAEQHSELFGYRDGIVAEPKPDLAVIDLDILAAAPARVAAQSRATAKITVIR